jgi:hypothetical protein
VSLWTQGLIKVPDSSSSVAAWWQQELAGLPKKMRSAKAAILMYTTCNIWKERNRRIFEHIHRNFKGIGTVQSFVSKVSIGKFPIGIQSFKIPMFFLHFKRDLKCITRAY